QSTGRGRSAAVAAPVDGEQLPFAGNSLKRLRAAEAERDVGADDEVANCAGDEHLAGLCEVGDPSADMDGHAREVIAGELALAGVKAGADVEVEPLDGVDHRQGAANGPRGAVERREHA